MAHFPEAGIEVLREQTRLRAGVFPACVTFLPVLLSLHCRSLHTDGMTYGVTLQSAGSGGPQHPSSHGQRPESDNQSRLDVKTILKAGLPVAPSEESY